MSNLLELVQIKKEAIVWSESRIKFYNEQINAEIMTGKDTAHWKNLRDAERETVAAIKLELGSAAALIYSNK
jgi:hypothetical protein